MKALKRLLFFVLPVCMEFATPHPELARQQSEKGTAPIAEIHEANPNGVLGVQGGVDPMSGPYVGSGLYRVRSASMLQLIAAAYGVSIDKVAGGPAWLAFNRYDVTAKLPAGATPETIETMLQTLLADRFKLVAHKGESPLDAWVLKAIKPSLKPAEGSGESGCQRQPRTATSQVPEGQDLFTCRNVTMQGFVEAIPKLVATNSLNGYGIYDQTGLKGSWDFDLIFRAQVGPQMATYGPVGFFDVLPKQLGLDMILTKVQLPAIVVEGVNSQQTANPANLADLLPKLPASFEVGEIKAVSPDDPRRNSTSTVQPGGRVVMENLPLFSVIQRAWDLPNRESFVGPKFLDTERVDVLAQVPALDGSDSAGSAAAARQADLVNPMLQKLIIERYKLQGHQEERPLTAYTLRAAKPKLHKADPANRSGCLRITGSLNASSPAATRLNGNSFECRNMTMAQFAIFLQYASIYSGLSRASVLDATGLDGAWDFTLAFSIILPAGQRGQAAAATTDASAVAPDARVSLSEALESQLGLKLETTKRPGPVFVIDHMEQKPQQ